MKTVTTSPRWLKLSMRKGLPPERTPSGTELRSRKIGALMMWQKDRFDERLARALNELQLVGRKRPPASVEEFDVAFEAAKKAIRAQIRDMEIDIENASYRGEET
jgi:hypothetical protein